MAFVKPPPVRQLDAEEKTAKTAKTRTPSRRKGEGSSWNAKRKVAAPKFSIPRMEVDGLSVAYDRKLAVKEVSLPIRQGEVLALIGPSGCGKTTLLRSLNRLTELTRTA